MRNHEEATMTRNQIIGRPMEVLLVEDDLEDAGMTIDALHQGHVPCRVNLVRSGEEALDFAFRLGRFRRAPLPDLILLDLGLPKLDGREILVQLKGDETLQRIPVVILTSSRTHREILEQEHLHVESYLTKPVDFDEFRGVVKSLRKYMLADVLLPQ
jgi:two-component system, chemotaxis family, response regulator Rcp1